MADCPRLGKLFGACKFSPRFDRAAPTIESLGRGDARAMVLIIEASKPTTYVRDVCETCGRTIERAQ